MSLPGISVYVERYHKIIAEALNSEGRPVKIKGQGNLSKNNSTRDRSFKWCFDY